MRRSLSPLHSHALFMKLTPASLASPAAAAPERNPVRDLHTHLISATGFQSLATGYQRLPAPVRSR